MAANWISRIKKAGGPFLGQASHPEVYQLCMLEILQILFLFFENME
jgi:hypothetical protein